MLEAYAGAGTGLWGKERLVEGLMLAQRASGDVDPRLVTFTPCSLADLMRGHGFRVDVLETQHRRVPARSLPALRRALASGSAAVVHTHGYKANLVGRLARASRAPMRGLVATCHAWFDETRATRLYNVLDRETAVFSDVTTVADADMLQLMPKRGRTAYVANGIPDCALPTAPEREAARARFDFPADRVVVGFLARTNAAKGIPEVLEAARRTRDLPIVWAIAGTGDLADAILEAALPNVRFFGYVADSQDYRAAIDVYLQASHIEGLSLSLLEAMRAGLPIVATSAGSTALALEDGIEGRIVAPGDVDALVAAVRGLAERTDAATRFGANARARFERDFRVDRQHRDFLAIYRSVVA
ncbi:MAG: glycosyltransferase [Vulcanimicrobiaceae bacterium]